MEDLGKFDLNEAMERRVVRLGFIIVFCAADCFRLQNSTRALGSTAAFGLSNGYSYACSSHRMNKDCFPALDGRVDKPLKYETLRDMRDAWLLPGIEPGIEAGVAADATANARVSG